MSEHRAPHLFIVIGEESGDALAAPFLDALRERCGANMTVTGLAGPRLQARGVKSLFPIEDIAVMGLTAVLARLPLILRRIRETADAVVAAKPDALMIIDSPDFTHRVAKRVRKMAPDIPIIGYVSPSVWAWRPGRARKMKAFVDHLLALFPFEPAVHERLGGPPCTYVGHRIIEKLADLTPAAGERTDGNARTRRQVLLLPGSRRGEVTRLGPVFRETVALIARDYDVDFILPAAASVEGLLRAEIASWQVKPQIVTGEAAKNAAFRSAHAALAASGTVTLELAVASVPMVVVYKLDWFYRNGRRLNRLFKVAKYDSIVLPNIILNTQTIPEFIDEEAEPSRLARELTKLLVESPERAHQLSEFSRLAKLMQPEGGVAPSKRAADIVSGFLPRPA